MRLLRNTSATSKLAVSSLLAITVVAAMVANQKWSEGDIQEASLSANNEQTILSGIISAKTAMNEMAVARGAFLQARSPNEVDAVLREAKASSEQAKADLATPIRIAKLPDVLIEIDRNLGLLTGELAATAAARSAEIAAGTVATTPVFSANALDLRQQTQDAIDEALANAKRFTESAKAELERTLLRASQVGLVMGLLAIAIVVGSALFLFAALARPLRDLTAVVGRLAEGDVTSDIPFIDQKDEIGGLAKAMAVFRDGLRERQRLEVEARQARDEQAASRDRQAAIDSAKAEDLRIFVHEVETAFGQLALGDLTVRMDGKVAAEFEPIRLRFNVAVGSLEEAIGSVVGSIGSIQVGLEQITVAAGDLSHRTEQQAANLEETVAALGQVTRGINGTADRAGQAQETATTAVRNAEKGGAVVSRAVEAMAEIERSSQRIGNIIGVIDEIAFQTNLLALNAGVEAARAGEAGRGFAVVAQEVRGLAQRSAEAAKEIKELIAASGTEVERGVELVSASGRSLQEIVAQVDQMSHLVGEIASSAKEQAISLREVSVAADQMDKVTQQNAAMVEETTAAAQSLSSKTADLARLTERFRTWTKPTTGWSIGAPGQQRSGAASPRPAPVEQLRHTGRGGAAPTQDAWDEF
ncbi:methyl-accepting chemotaxis protein [Aureimonas sp. SK2]|uniref:methyl-accepting chemotaxis protein n=1 Tax=Aureimonas sp. SK2 TaxID=3015992 RepID=UPI002443D05F|nr:HAMP domain-containing methyl-accepting chemotaxis protein [Aureimonas sp. SK2]